MPVDDVSNESASRARSSDPMHTIITPPDVDLRHEPEEMNLEFLQAELRRLSTRVAALEAENEQIGRRSNVGKSTHSQPTHQAGAPTIRRRTRTERQTGWQPTKR